MGAAESVSKHLMLYACLPGRALSELGPWHVWSLITRIACALGPRRAARSSACGESGLIACAGAYVILDKQWQLRDVL